ncbi:MAG: hypothetical protein EKK50_05695 [Sphingomonadaceae bacterium]|nr:MAG: hypothetical protein EKK50_05695 [Sphingomonadaceae bacterium]
MTKERARARRKSPSFPRRRESRLANLTLPSPTAWVMNSRLRGNDVDCGAAAPRHTHPRHPGSSPG